MAKTIFGVFPDRVEAEDALIKLEGMGYNPKDFSIIMRDRKQAEEVSRNTGAGVAGGTISGATTGAVLGGLAGLLVGTGVIPGLGVLLIGGPLAAALGLTGAAATAVSGATTGAIAGGIIGALTTLGLSSEDAILYEESIKRGNILVAVPARSGDEDEVRMVLEDYGADQIKVIDQADLSTSVRRGEDRYSSAYFSEVERDKKSRRGR